MKKELPKCIDCEHSFQPYKHDEKTLHCRRCIFEVKPTHLVTGSADEISYWDCDILRDCGWFASRMWGICDRRGRFFEPKEACTE